MGRRLYDIENVEAEWHSTQITFHVGNAYNQAKQNDMNKNSLVLETLKTEQNALTFSFSLQLSAIYPEKAIMQTKHYAFDLDDFVRYGHATSTPRTDFHNAPEWNYWEEKNSAYPSWDQAWNDIVWQGHTLEVVLVSFTANYRDRKSVV